ncbi:hypothetical protein [Paraferrimonas sedimenticola]|uniref:ParB/Sulfiredoxin domain-containing protein n=1 Tax=Paraferrimonas sedimenticola TaxID=375674 RepID=A0AA37RUU6_9GAMM|nr:hypothetical protein [Paraferrimonas sedimenticola]GLP95249.1 hypothetical protein GCM10007895_05550 [Paraferrimonas sedimenticola]
MTTKIVSLNPSTLIPNQARGFLPDGSIYLDDTTVEQLRKEEQKEPILVYCVQGDFHLVNGHHRAEACSRNDVPVLAEVHHDKTLSDVNRDASLSNFRNITNALVDKRQREHMVWHFLRKGCADGLTRDDLFELFGGGDVTDNAIKARYTVYRFLVENGLPVPPRYAEAQGQKRDFENGLSDGQRHRIKADIETVNSILREVRDLDNASAELLINGFYKLGILRRVEVSKAAAKERQKPEFQESVTRHNEALIEFQRKQLVEQETAKMLFCLTKTADQALIDRLDPVTEKRLYSQLKDKYDPEPEFVAPRCPDTGEVLL